MGVRDFGLFVAEIVPNVITSSAWVSAVAVRQQFVIITQPLLCTGTLGTVGVSWVSAYQDRIRRYVKPITPIFVNLSCTSLAAHGRRRAKPIDSGNSVTGCASFDRGRAGGTVQSMAVDLMV